VSVSKLHIHFFNCDVTVNSHKITNWKNHLDLQVYAVLLNCPLFRISLTTFARVDWLVKSDWLTIFRLVQVPALTYDRRRGLGVRTEHGPEEVPERAAAFEVMPEGVGNGG
jgi:hypothetical protein